MRSSSTDRRGPRPANAGAWVRLALVGVLGAAALVAPSAVGRTGAIYTDTQTVGFTVVPSASPAPTTSPTSGPTTSPTSDPTATAAATAPVAGAPAEPAPTPSEEPNPTPTPTVTVSPAAMLPTTGRGHPKTSGPADH